MREEEEEEEEEEGPTKNAATNDGDGRWQRTMATNSRGAAVGGQGALHRLQGRWAGYTRPYARTARRPARPTAPSMPDGPRQSWTAHGMADVCVRALRAPGRALSVPGRARALLGERESYRCGWVPFEGVRLRRSAGAAPTPVASAVASCESVL